jgi:hypothetical protein
MHTDWKTPYRPHHGSLVKSSRYIFLIALVISLDVCFAQQPSLAPTAVLDERADISTELRSLIDLQRMKTGERVILKVLQDARVSSAITIPKGAKLTAKVTLMQPCPLYGSSADAAMALLVDEANWKDQNLPIRAYLWGQITSIELATRLATDPVFQDIHDLNYSRIGATQADPLLGSVIGFGCTQMVGPDCSRQPQPGRCDEQRLQSGSTLVVRHLPSRYQLGLLYDDNAYAAARTAEVGALGGSADAAFGLAQRLHNGDLFVKDDAQALRWFRVAAEGGHLAAQTNLAVFLAQGLGSTAPDFVGAYKWFAVSAECGVEQNKAALHKLEQMLTPEQVAEGKRLSAEWLQAHPKQQ